VDTKPTPTELVLVDELIQAFSTTTLIQVGLKSISSSLPGGGGGDEEVTVMLRGLDSWRETCSK
jgi:hypothetical protein